MFFQLSLSSIQIEEQKETIRFELEGLDFRPDVEPELTDLIHAVRLFSIIVVFRNTESFTLKQKCLFINKMLYKHIKAQI